MNERDLFIAALQIEDPAKRAAYLDQACGGDNELRKRLDILLAAHDRPASARESPVAANPQKVPTGTEPDETGGGCELPASDEEPTASEHQETPAPASLIGTIIAGRYKLRQEIGEGGMGSVYLAEQTQPVMRQVALKLIKPGMDSRAVLARFESERQALALMDHPHIAKVFDAGSTEGGQPFFVMELVKGIPLTEYCDQHRLGLPERLALFRQICSAVQHAHQKGIIHRDLKPTNILVESHDGEPVPKVIDFGLAKATSGLQLSEHSLFTAFGTVAGTPLYMAPEQASFNALDIDTRADIYALGVILYELLTGSTPIRRETFRKAALEEMLRLIREVEPPTPSSRISTSETLPSIAATRQSEPARLSRFVRGDLDWIVMKALAKERNRRYESAIALAQDIERFTHHEPVSAGPPTASYRFRKFARRNRAALATAGVFALLLVAATSVSAVLAVWANRERVRALSAEKSAKEQQVRAQDREEMAIDAVRRYGDVVRETPELKNNPSLAKLRATLLREPQTFFKRLRDRLQSDRETTPDSLDRLAKASFDMGDLTAEIGDKQDALRAFEEARAILERLARENPSVTLFQRDLAMSQGSIGNLQSATGRPAEALASYDQARAILERLTRENPSVTRFQRDLAATHDNIGILQRETGRPAEALASYEQARAIDVRLTRENPSVTQFQSALAKSHINIGLLQSETGRPAEAIASFEQARAIVERLTRENPSVTEFQSDLAKSHNNIGLLQSETGRPAEALASYEQARAIFERLAREHPSVTEFQSDLAKSYFNIGFLQSDTGRPTEALASSERARATFERLTRENPSVTEFQSALAKSYFNIGRVQSATGRPAEALASYEQARAIFERLTRENLSVTQFQSALANSHINIGLLHSETGRPAEAIASFERARAIFERLTRENPSVTAFQSDLARGYSNIGRLQSGTGRPAEAIASFEQARAILERLARENPSVTPFQSELAKSHNNIGLLQSETGRPAEALASHEQARAIRERLTHENTSVTEFQSNLAASHYNIGSLKSATGRPAEGAGVVRASPCDPGAAGARPSRLARLHQPIGRNLEQHGHDRPEPAAIRQGPDQAH